MTTAVFATTVTPRDFRLYIVRPSLQTVRLWSLPAEDLLLGTAIQETRLRNIDQKGGGPAKGYFQVELFTHNDIWSNYLRYRPNLADRVRSLCSPPIEYDQIPGDDQLESSPQYECAIARIKYLRSPCALPKYGDVRGYAQMWKAVYNSAAGAGTVEEFVRNWHNAHADMAMQQALRSPDTADGAPAMTQPLTGTGTGTDTDTDTSGGAT